MHQNITRSLNKLQQVSKSLLKPTHQESSLQFNYQGQAASDQIRKALDGDQPCMICRFGSTELTAVIRYFDIRDESSFPTKILKYLQGEMGPFWWDDSIAYNLSYYSGFFPATNQYVAQFGEKMLEDAKNIDILGSWLVEERRIASYFPNATIIPLGDLEPYFHITPWSEALKGKTVLVIHPFEESIKYQYTRREKLFKDPNILPDFELKTLKAVQTIAGQTAEFYTWFNAFDFMCEKISRTSFDVAIIGAGAYGFPLASYVKNMGKKAIHLGGATQILFGIKGKRWDSRPFFQQLYNNYWIRPIASEVPEKYLSVENGCYW